MLGHSADVIHVARHPAIQFFELRRVVREELLVLRKLHLHHCQIEEDTFKAKSRNDTKGGTESIHTNGTMSVLGWHCRYVASYFQTGGPINGDEV